MVGSFRFNVTTSTYDDEQRLMESLLMLFYFGSCKQYKQAQSQAKYNQINYKKAFQINTQPKATAVWVCILCKCENTLICISKLEWHHKFSGFIDHWQQPSIALQFILLCLHCLLTFGLTCWSCSISSQITQQSKLSTCMWTSFRFRYNLVCYWSCAQCSAKWPQTKIKPGTERVQALADILHFAMLSILS